MKPIEIYIFWFYIIQTGAIENFHTKEIQRIV